MIEYIHDAIRATAGNTLAIAAEITDDSGNQVIAGCAMMIFNNEELIITADGEYLEEQWIFTIPAEATKNLKGRYSYCICQENTKLCFKQPIYFV